MGESTTVIVADDHAMMRDGIKSILSQAKDVTVVAEAANGREAVELAAIHAPDVMFIDVGMPELNGLEATRKIHAKDPAIAIIALSMHSDARYVTGMLDAGARGYLLKTCDADELLRAMEAVQKRKIYVTSDVTHVLLDNRHSRGSSSGDSTGAPPLDILTPREREVLQLVAEGLTNREIGAKIGAAIKTVETHRGNVIRKLGLHSIAELTKYAIREGLTRLEQ